MTVHRYGTMMVLSGPSGAGKSTACAQLLARHPGLDFSVSCTTRSPRPSEVDGVHYRFVTCDQFQERLMADAFLEHAQVHGSYYGTLRPELETRLAQGGDVLLDIDVQGARQIRQRIHGSFLADCAVFVFFAPPTYRDLEARLRGRGSESEEAISQRLRNAREELRTWPEYDYLVVNDQVEFAVDLLEAILESAAGAVRRVRDFDPFVESPETGPTEGGIVESAPDPTEKDLSADSIPPRPGDRR